MPRKFFRKYLPDHAQVRDHPWLRRFKPVLKHPNLWHLNRHSVAGGFCFGLIGGLIPGPVQMLVAAILAILFRVNLPVAVATTLLTNPFTWPFIIVAALAIGRLVTGAEGSVMQEFDFDWQNQSWSEFLPEFWRWMLGLGETFLIGNAILALGLGVLGYFAVQAAWRLYILAYLRRRRLRRNAAQKTLL
ncbi:MAG: DUF2062 domain-containing protein [Betaproteobacteria bacterium]|nr:DUF2062 domain-containing protein [Betaproteobacteria bacterium]